MSRNLLALDCATRGAAVVVRRADGSCAERVTGGRGRQAERLLPMLEEVLGELALRARDLDAFALTAGPGSFTSLRVAVATIKGLAFGTTAPIAAVSTLQADAWAARGESRAAPGTRDAETSLASDRPFAAVLDAQRGDWYAGAWTAASGSGLSESLAETLYTPDELAVKLPEQARIGGEPSDALRAHLAERGRDDLVWSPAVAGTAARAHAVAALGARLIESGGATSAGALTPRYFRRAEAEAQRLGRPLEDAHRGR